MSETKFSRHLPGVPLLDSNIAREYFDGDAYEFLDEGIDLAQFHGVEAFGFEIPLVIFPTISDILESWKKGGAHGLYKRLGQIIQLKEMIVFSERNTVEQLLTERSLAPFETGPLEDVMGKVSAVLTGGEDHLKARQVTGILIKRLKENQTSLQEKIAKALKGAAEKNADLSSALTEVFVEWLVTAALGETSDDKIEITKEQALKLLSHIKGVPLFFKPLRSIHPSWYGFASASDALQASLNYQNKPFEWAAFRTCMLAFDSLSASSLNALIYAQQIGWRPGSPTLAEEVVNIANKNTPPFTLAVRQALKEVIIGSYKIPQGVGVAANLRESAYRFGHGAHACMGAALEDVAQKVLNGFPWADYEITYRGYQRNRLNTAPKKVRAVPRHPNASQLLGRQLPWPTV